MIPILLSFVSIGVVAMELATGMAVLGGGGDWQVIDRETRPVQYWFVMAIHLAAAVGIPVLAYYAFRW